MFFELIFKKGHEASYEQLALSLAEKGLGHTHPNPSVGCVLVRDGEVVGSGTTGPPGQGHAEVQALQMAGAKARGATAYVTLEPCNHTGKTPPCTGALIKAQVAKVIVGALDPNPRVFGQGVQALRAAGIVVEVEKRDTFARGSQTLIQAFAHGLQHKKPYVVGKMATSLDGKVAKAPGEQTSLTGAEANCVTHELRDKMDAILTSASTVQADNPQLNIRLKNRESTRQPIKIVLDRTLKTSLTSKLFDSGVTWVFHGESATAELVEKFEKSGVRLVEIRETPQGLCLETCLRAMCEMGLTSVLLECGPTLMDSFLEQNLVQEFWHYRAPSETGPAGLGIDTAFMDTKTVCEKQLGLDFLSWTRL